VCYFFFTTVLPTIRTTNISTNIQRRPIIRAGGAALFKASRR